MISYLVKRLLLAVFVAWAALTLMFLLMWAMPGDAVDAAGGEKFTGTAQLANKRAKYGLDKPILVQYERFFVNLSQGDLGYSVKNDRSVNDDLKETMGTSLRLLFWGGVVQIGGSLILGFLAAARPRSAIDRLTTVGSVSAQAIPVFVTGLLASYVFGVLPNRWDWQFLNFARFWPSEWRYLVLPADSSWRAVVLPALTVGIVQMALLARLLRSSMLEVLRADYLRTARAKGLSQWRVLGKHAFRNALIPYITAAGLALVEIFGIAVQTETVFGIYGLGSKISQAAQIQDAAVVLGLSSVVIIAATLMTLLVDFSYSVIDPRIRLDEGGMK